MAHDVFISYSSKDKRVADAICSILEQEKIKCWIAPRDILPGDNYGEAIVKAIESCEILILLFSDNANKSRHIANELERALNYNNIIVPFRIEDVMPSKKIEYYLSSSHWIEALTPPVEKQIYELSHNIRRILNRDSNLYKNCFDKEKNNRKVRNYNFYDDIQTIKENTGSRYYRSKRIKKYIVIGAVLLLISIYPLYNMLNKNTNSTFYDGVKDYNKTEEDTLISTQTSESTTESKSEQTAESTSESKSKLSELDYFNARGLMFWKDTAKDNLGNTYPEGGFKCAFGNDNKVIWREYVLNGEYTAFKGKVILNYDYRSDYSNAVQFKVWGDNKLLFSSSMMKNGSMPEEFDVNLTGILKLKVEFVSQNANSACNIFVVNDGLYQSAESISESKSEQIAESTSESKSKLSELDHFDARGLILWKDTPKDNLGNSYPEGGFICAFGIDNKVTWREYVLNGEYTAFKGKVILNYAYRSDPSNAVQFKVWGDNKLLFSSSMMKNGSMPEEFDVNLTGILKLKVEFVSQNANSACNIFVVNDGLY